jgi:transposase
MSHQAGKRSGPRRPAGATEGSEPEKPLGLNWFVDGGYSGDETQRAAFEASRIKVSVVKRSDRTVKGFVGLPKRWIVERTLGWLNRARRLAKDFEAMIESSRAWVMLALGFLLLRRLGRNYRQRL